MILKQQFVMRMAPVTLSILYCTCEQLTRVQVIFLNVTLYLTRTPSSKLNVLRILNIYCFEFQVHKLLHPPLSSECCISISTPELWLNVNGHVWCQSGDVYLVWLLES